MFHPRGWVKGVVLAGALPWVTLCWGLTSDERNTIQVYQTASPSVVHIRAVVVRHGFFYQPYPVEGAGSGVVMDRQGHIVTNAHVVKDARSLEVTLADGSHWPAVLVRSLPEEDLAAIRIEAPPDSLHPIAMGISEELRVGQKVLAIGNPFGLQQSLTQGVISSLDRSLATPDGGKLQGLIQTDAAINPGNSGGPLLDREGRLVGINTAIVSPSGGSVGVGFAIPVESVKRHLPRLVRERGVPWLSALLALAGVAILIWLWVTRYRRGPRW
jgi:S1-C subfamily serine protease